MSRNRNKKPVGFATHIIAGGFAGGCEAVSYSKVIAFERAVKLFRSYVSPLIPLRSGCNFPSRDLRLAWVEISTLWSIWFELTWLCQTKPRGFLATGAYIVKRETPLALYKGLGAVLSGIVPKMAIRFGSFETYKNWLADAETGKTSVGNIFLGTFPVFFFFRQA